MVLNYMRYRLRTLVILTGVGPPVLAWILLGDPLVVTLAIAGMLELLLLYWVYWAKDAAARRHASWKWPMLRVTTRDVLAILGIAVASCLAGLGLWAANTPEELAPVVGLFMFGTACYGLGTFINHASRT